MNKFSTLAKLSATLFAGFWLTGCGPTEVERGLAQRLTYDVRPDAPLLVASVSCEAPKRELRDCMVHYDSDVKLPDTPVQVAAPKGSFPASFKFEHFWNASGWRNRYIANVETPLEGQTVAAGAAAKLLAGAVDAAAAAAQAQLGEQYTTSVTAYKNLESYRN